MNNLITEENLLAILMNGKKVDIAIEQLKVDMFEGTLNKHIFRTIQELYLNDKQIDLVTIYNSCKVKITSLGGITKLTEISSTFTTEKNYSFLADKIIEDYNRKNIFNILKENIDKLSNGEDISKIVSELASIDSNVITNDEKGNGEIIESCEKLMLDVEEAMKNGGGVTGMKRGIACIDERTNGKTLGDYDCIAGRPGSGKTTFAINEIIGLLYNGHKVEFYSLEMSKEQILLKLACRMKQLDSIKVSRGEISKEEKFEFDMALINLINYENEGKFKLYSKEKGETDGTVEDIIIKTRKNDKQASILGNKKTDVIYIDHIGIVDTKKEFVNTVAQVKYKSTKLRSLALELNINITILSQLSRACEQRSDHRPILSDLRESGDLEQDLCNIMFIYRDEYYNKDTEDKNIIECISAKARMGTTGMDKLAWIPQASLVLDLDCGGYI